MQALETYMFSLLAAHPHTFTLTTVWFVLSILLTQLLKLRTLSQWEAAAETYPRYAAFAKLVRAVGIDPVSGLRWLLTVIFGKANVPLPPLGTLFLPLCLAISGAGAGVGFATLMQACTPAQQADAMKIEACVFDGEAKGLAPGAIALQCGLSNAQDVIDFLARADRRAAMRYDGGGEAGKGDARP